MNSVLNICEKPTAVEPWEPDLDALEAERRAVAMIQFESVAREIDAAAPPSFQPGNLHAHTFHSFNCYGFSPTRYALLARRFGMEVAGIVDFDTLDGAEEFHAAGRLLNLRTVVSVETRVMVPEFATRVINSPGEPGIAYHMACGFVRRPTQPRLAAFLQDLRERSARRNRAALAKVNAFLSPLNIDYERDVLSLTPSGNATERHIVLAFAREAAQMFTGHELADFWRTKLGTEIRPEDLPESPALLNLIRAKTLKKGGPGYVEPSADAFPPLADFNAWAVRCGAIPTIAWLDGSSPGEQAMEEYMALNAAGGVCALNIIPDRNFTPGLRDERLRRLYEVVKLAVDRNWILIAGTEMNSFGQRWIDQFDTDELRPLVPHFQRGARVLYAHTALQRHAGLGFLGPWADKHLPRREDRVAWFEELGRFLKPSNESKLAAVSPADSPDEIRRHVLDFVP